MRQTSMDDPRYKNEHDLGIPNAAADWARVSVKDQVKDQATDQAKDHVKDQGREQGREQAREAGETLASRIRDSLVDAITSGQIAPGSEIDEQELAQSFGASRTPVREALRELASAGLVIIEPRRGARVVEMSADRIGELFELMAEIEAVCVKFATNRITAHERSHLSHIHAASGQLAQAGDVDGYDRLNLDFHATIYAATRNRELQNHALTLRRRGAPFRRAQFRGVHRLKSSWAEHDGILQEIFAGDGDRAARLMRVHMLKAGTVYADYVEEQRR